jgi:hypothetical protein
MSEKLVHGENGNSISNIENKGESESPLSEKLVHGNFGQAYIKNNSTSNSSFEKEQEYYHQGAGAGPDDKKPVPLFSLEQAKEIMHYDYWRSESLSWGELKAHLGHFPDLGDKARYERKIIEILDEIARHARYMPGATQEPESVSAVFESETFTIFFDNVLTHWDEIRSVKGYVKASLKNVVANQALRKQPPTSP